MFEMVKKEIGKGLTPRSNVNANQIATAKNAGMMDAVESAVSVSTESCAWMASVYACPTATARNAVMMDAGQAVASAQGRRKSARAANACVSPIAKTNPADLTDAGETVVRVPKTAFAATLEPALQIRVRHGQRTSRHAVRTGLLLPLHLVWSVAIHHGLQRKTTSTTRACRQRLILH